MAGPARTVRSWQTAHYRHNCWSADGTWGRLLRVAHRHADEQGELGWVVSVDSSIVRVHQHAAGARRHDTIGPGELHESAV